MNNDLISRKALKKKLKEKIDLDQDAEFDRGYYVAIKACIGIIDNFPAVEAYTKEECPCYEEQEKGGAE